MSERKFNPMMIANMCDLKVANQFGLSFDHIMDGATLLHDKLDWVRKLMAKNNHTVR